MKAEYKEKLDLIQDSVYNIKNAIIEKGVQIADTEDITTFAEKIGQIQGGGGDLPEIHDDDPLTFVRMDKAAENGFVSLTYSSTSSSKKFQYNKNDEGWIDYTIGYEIPMNYADKVQFKCTSQTTTAMATNPNLYHNFKTSGFYFCGGLLSSMVQNYDSGIKSYCFYRLFANTNIISAPKIVNAQGSYACGSMFLNCALLLNAPELPSMTIYSNCYDSMFKNCINLKNAPELPSTSAIGAYGYQYMFDGCTSLVNAPSILPATEVGTYGYNYMFNGCTSLINGPSEISATKCGNYGFQYMFNGCTSLINAPEIKTITLGNYSFSFMFSGCKSLVNGPSILPATTLYSNVYQNMFRECSSLTQSPKLPAETLASNCYYYMFYNCSKLKTVYCNGRYAYGTTVITTSISSDWLRGVPDTEDCIFYKNANWTGPTSRGASTIPSKWQLATYS